MTLSNLSRPKPGERVRLSTPDNPRLDGAGATVAELFDWGALVRTSAAGSGQFRAAWVEMVPLAGLNGATGFTGEVCNDCGGLRMVRSGACSTCQDCGASGGCG